MKSRSLCCNSDTRIGYYYAGGDNEYIAVATIGTYCTKCDKLCNTRRGKKYYYPNGDIINNQIIRNIKLDELKKYF